MTTRGDDLDNEIKGGIHKKKMFIAEVDDLKQNIEKLDESTSYGVIHLKDLKE